MFINPYNPILSNSSVSHPGIQPLQTEIEAKTDQLKIHIPSASIEPSQIPLPKDLHGLHGYHFYHDIHPASHEIEEGVFLKTTYHPSMRLEGVENFQNLETKKDAIGNEYIGFFPEGCTLENDIFKSSGRHKFVGVFDHSGKLTTGSWTWIQDNLGFTLEGSFTYQETETSQIILCEGVYTFAGKYMIAKGVFEVERNNHESYFYCTKRPGESLNGPIETKTDAKGCTRTGIFNGDKLLQGKKDTPNSIYEGLFSKEEMLIEGSKTFKRQKMTVTGLWNYEKNRKGTRVVSIISRCHGRKLESPEKGCFQEESLERGKIERESGTVIEGQFFSLQTNNNVPTQITIYKKGQDPEIKWTLHGNYYHSKEDAKNSLYPGIGVIQSYLPW
jgi:hypothetical protein